MMNEQIAGEILLLSGETSGDLHGSQIIKELKNQYPNLKFTAVGSEHMRSEGAKILYDVKNLSVMGFTEVFKKLPQILSLFKKIYNYVDARRPMLIILIDNPDFNLRIAKKIKRQFPFQKCVYFISPSIWAWRYNRINIIKKFIDKMLVVLPFEEKIYQKENVPVSFIGHPLIKEWEAYLPKEPKHLNTNGKKKIILVPGSRSFEIKKLLPTMIEAAEKIYKKDKNTEFVIVKAPLFDNDIFAPYTHNKKAPFTVSHKALPEVMQNATFAIVASGTATLETGLMGVPMVVVYKFSPLTYFLAAHVVRIRIKHFSLVNILSEVELVPELLQQNVTPDKIIEKTMYFLNDTSMYNETSNKLLNLRTKLYKGDPFKICIEELKEFL